MKVHPARTKAQHILRKAGIDAHGDGNLSLRIASLEYNAHPLIVDIRCSSQDDNLARFEVCHLYSEHSEYAKVVPFHMQEFNF